MLIETSLGKMDARKLKKVVHQVDNANERTTVTEYYLEGVSVHRSVDVVLKQASVTAAMLCAALK